MKFSKVLLGLSLCSMILSSGAGVALAAPGDGGAADTKGTIDFELETDPAGVIIKPDTDDEIIPEGGNSTTGNLRIQYVPDFNFGTQKLKTGKQEFKADYMEYKYTDKDGFADQYFMPQFVQVSDTRGTNEGFELTVKASVFQRETATADSLPNAKITLLNAQLYNTVYSNAEISEKVTTFKGAKNAGTGTLAIPTDNNALVVMKTNSNNKVDTTNGTQTSLLLSETYNKNDHTALATDKNLDVLFTKENKDIATVLPTGTVDPYVSNITWTLTDAK